MTSELKNSFDENTITPSDYTIYFYLEPSITESFDEREYKPNDTKSRGDQFKDWMLP